MSAHASLKINVWSWTLVLISVGVALVEPCSLRSSCHGESLHIADSELAVTPFVVAGITGVHLDGPSWGVRASPSLAPSGSSGPVLASESSPHVPRPSHLAPLLCHLGTSGGLTNFVSVPSSFIKQHIWYVAQAVR